MIRDFASAAPDGSNFDQFGFGLRALTPHRRDLSLHIIQEQKQTIISLIQDISKLLIMLPFIDEKFLSSS